MLVKQGYTDAGGKHIGVVPKYSTPEEMQERIDTYFEDCAGEGLKNKNGRPTLIRRGRPVKTNEIYKSNALFTLSGALLLCFGINQIITEPSLSVAHSK